MPRDWHSRSLRFLLAGVEPFFATATSQPKLQHHFPLVSNATETFDRAKHWGNLSPQYSVKSFGLNTSAAIPSQCSLTQVHLVSPFQSHLVGDMLTSVALTCSCTQLHRHGARYSTSGSGTFLFGDRIVAAQKSHSFKAIGSLAFLNDWTYPLGAEVLTPFGREQLFQLGVSFRVKYGRLLEKLTKPPVFRTTSQDRMVNSALNFAAGFFGMPFEPQYHQEIMIEGASRVGECASYLSPL